MQTKSVAAFLNKRALAISTILVAFLTASEVAQAQFSVTISVDESGHGLFTNTAGFSSSLASGMQADPGPGGLASALTYSLLDPPGLTAGDLILLDPSTNTSDIIRFNPSETAPDGSTGAFVFYSLAGEGTLADTGFPSAFYANTFTLPENILGATSYTPTAGEPGFVTGAGGPVTYQITSNVASVPDFGNSFLLLSIALLGMSFLRRLALPAVR
jgi:hypothetical protein